MQRLRRAFYYFLKDRETFFYFLLQRSRKQANALFSPITKKSFYLQKLWLPLTYRCNLRCRMCGQWGDLGRSFSYAPEKLKEELSLEKLKEIIDEVAIFRPRICLIGGEPFLFPHWRALAAYIKEKKLFCEVTTNGLALEENSEALFPLFDAVHVSLDGPPEINDRIRGIQGGFEQAFAGLRKLALMKKEKKSSRPFLSVCMTLFPENMAALIRLAEAIEKRAVFIDLLLFQHLELVTPQLIEETNRRWEKEFGWRTEWWQANCHDVSQVSIEKLFQEIEEVKRKKFSFIGQVLFEPDFSFEELVIFYKKVNEPLPCFQGLCQAPFQEAFIYPDGTVWTCPGLPRGNVREKKFLDIFNGKEYQELRKSLVEKGPFALCNHCANFWHNFST